MCVFFEIGKDFQSFNINQNENESNNAYYRNWIFLKENLDFCSKETWKYVKHIFCCQNCSCYLHSSYFLSSCSPFFSKYDFISENEYLVESDVMPESEIAEFFDDDDEFQDQSHVRI